MCDSREDEAEKDEEHSQHYLTNNNKILDKIEGSQKKIGTRGWDDGVNANA